MEKEVGDSGGSKVGWWDEECIVRNRGKEGTEGVDKKRGRGRGV